MAKLYGTPNGCPDGFVVSEFDPTITDTRCEEGVYFFLYQRDLKTVDMLERFADRLSFMPGRKALIWITTASDARDPRNAVGHVPATALADYPVSHTPHAKSTNPFAESEPDPEVFPLHDLPQMEARIEHAIRKLNNADVGLYMVNPCAFIKLDACYARTNVMQDFAKRTGGQAILDPYDAPAVLRAAIEDVRTTYSLAFYAPPDADLSKFHQLKVQVNRPGVTLSYRQGYSLGTDLNAASLVKDIPGAEARALRAKAMAMAPSVFMELEGLAAIPAAGSFGAAMTVPYFYTGANVAVVDLAIEMGVDRLKFVEANGKRSAELNLAAQAVRADGSVAAKFTDTEKLSFATEAEAEAFLKRPYRYEHQFRLAPGAYDVRVAFGSGVTSLGGASTPLEIGGWDGKTLAISGVALARETRKADSGAAALEARKALVSRGMETIPTGDVRFKRGEPCKAYFEIYDPSRASSNAARLSAQLRVLDEAGAQKVDSGAFAVDGLAKPGTQMVPVSLSVPVDGLTPGRYRLEVKAMRADGVTVTRLAEFAVE